MEKKVTEVVAALIWDGDRFLICQRPAHKARGLLWEFVGGKVEPGETKEQALIRECREELDVTLSVGEVFMEVDHEYPDLNVHLTLFNAAISEGMPRMLEHNDIRWITVEEIPRSSPCTHDGLVKPTQGGLARPGRHSQNQIHADESNFSPGDAPSVRTENRLPGRTGA